MGTIIVSIILISIISSIIYKMIKDKKSGKSIQCGCGCEQCSSHCHH